MRQIFGADGSLRYTIREVGDDQHIYDASGNLVYRFVRASNMTYDASGNLVMRGNIVLDLGR